jgi:hypothetical protein
LRKLATAVLFALVLIFGAGPQKAEAQTMGLCLTNSASYIIYVRAFSANRDAVWPAGAHWIFNDRAERCALLSCVPGEKICYGGTDNANRYWGVGYNGNQGCANCCGFCNNATYRWNMTN